MDSTRMPTDSLHWVAAAANLPPSASAYSDSLLSAPANQIKRRYWHHSELSFINSMNSPSIYADESMVDFNPGWGQSQQEHQAIVPPNASQLDANPVNTTTYRYAPCHDLGRPLTDSDNESLSRAKRLERLPVNAIVNNGNKFCSSKPNNCLKLFCECFSNKYYCSEACACEGCYNTQDYEDLVQKLNEQIEYRNQHAFSASVTDHNTIDSVRHRNICNCKKSRCQKKYCECYLAGVGCSLNCQTTITTTTTKPIIPSIWGRLQEPK